MPGDDPALLVYAFSEPGLPPRMRILGRQLRTLTFGPVAAVVEGRPQTKEITAGTLREHHAVVLALAGRASALLPVRFGSSATEGALRSIAASNARALAAALDRVRGRVQMTIRVFGPPDRARPAEERGRGGLAYLRSRRKRLQHLPAEVRVVRDALASLACSERAEAGSGGLRLTVFHLVPAADAERYRERAAALQSPLAPLQVTVSGPWPPFAFSPELFP